MITVDAGMHLLCTYTYSSGQLWLIFYDAVWQRTVRRVRGDLPVFGYIPAYMSLMQCWSQVTQLGVIIEASAVEVINCVYQKSHNYKTTPSPALLLAGCTVFSIKRTAPNTVTVQPRTTLNQLHAQTAMYLSDQPSWWTRPATHVQLAGHVSITDISCRRLHMCLGHWRPRITAPATSVLTQLPKSPLGLALLKGFFTSPESVVELCRVPNLPHVSTCRVWCVPNDNLMITANDGVHLSCT